jgi:hypothetical protein
MGKWETTNKLLKIIGTDEPVTRVIYTYENDLLEKPGWKHPRTYEQALSFDNRNNNTLRGDTTTSMISSLVKVIAPRSKPHMDSRRPKIK